MKKGLLLCIATILLILESCNKNYTCVCTNSTTSVITQIPIDKVSKSYAETTCKKHQKGMPDNAHTTCVIR